jgi:hypothetical protein
MVLVGCGTSLVYYQYAVEKEKAVMDRFVDTESSILPAEIAVLLKKTTWTGSDLYAEND